MIVTVSPTKLRGRVELPSSKSELHRLLIAAALADAPTEIHFSGALCDDTAATLRCIAALGAGVSETDGKIIVTPIAQAASCPRLDCGESASTLRFLLPVAAAMGADAVFTGGGSLPARPLSGMTALLREHGCTVSGDPLPLKIGGRLCGHEFAAESGLTSQYISGLMLALPLIGGGEIAPDGEAVSAGYIDMTADVLRRFGVDVRQSGGRRIISGSYRSPKSIQAQEDLGAAAVWLGCNALGGEISFGALPEKSMQPDGRMPALLQALVGDKMIDCSESPDLLPVLAAVAAGIPESRVTIYGGERLRAKESDRLACTAVLLKALGAIVEMQDGGLVIRGGGLHGGEVSACGDHRIAMAAAVAACACDGAVTITGAETVSKSYPDFWEDYRGLGGRLDVVYDR